MSVYQYDGSLEGFYCAVFRAVRQKETPEAIEAFGARQMRLFPPVEIKTVPEQAARVRGGIQNKISPEALELTETVFCSCLEEKELHLLRFLLRGFRGGVDLRQGFSDPELARLLSAKRHLLNEAHLLKGFVRFADYDGHLAAVITPKNFLLPFIARHFCVRYRNEDFMIFDQTHHVAFLYEQRQPRMVAADRIDFPDYSADEQAFRALWKQFYRTVAIEGRENPRCRMTHMPKRYWANMTEME
ncbi:MAG: TIGR03915 family putative DNA repair protein [Oscillospiraceae bacterium]|jgi:probable DNA metabolism protein|nr:TIGR03915 family putative DNA repair protein [Oscillospiraceae bacterium]